MANPITPFAEAGDGLVRRYGTTWATIRASATGDDVTATGAGDYGVWAEHTNPGIGRSFYPFDTSAIPDSADVITATLYVWVTAASAAAGGSFMVVESTQASTSSLTTADYDAVGSTELSSRVNFSGLATGAYLAIPLNAAGRALINKTGYTQLALRSSFDLDNSAPSGATSQMQVKFSEQTGTSNDPYLEVLYGESRSTSDAWAWSDSSSGSVVLGSGRVSADTWGWSDGESIAYWRANRVPVVVQQAGASTTLNGTHVLPTGTITVSSTAEFPSSGTIVLSSSWVQTEVTYTGKTGTTFTGCTGGTGTYGTGALVMARDSESNFPQVVPLSDGVDPGILCAYIQKPGHGGSIGFKIVGKISTNGGRTWGTQFDIVSAAVNGSSWGGGGFTLTRLLNGRLLIVWFEGNGSGGLVRSYLSYSDDNGATWSSPSAQLTSPFPGGTDVCAVGFGAALYTGPGSNGTYGDLYVTCYGNDSATYDNTATYNRLMKVTDGGAAGTWTSVGTINTQAQLSGRAAEEASLVILDDGTWVSHIRAELYAGGGFTTLDRYQAKSTDLGVTWSGHTRIAQNLGNAGVSHQLPTGELITQGEEFTLSGRGVPLSTITFISSDRGTSWPTTSWRQEETDGTYAGGVGSDFSTIADTSSPRRRVLNAYSQENSTQSASQVKFQWYSAPWVTDDTWAWTDSAARGAYSYTPTTTDTWTWTDNARVGVYRASADTWAWSDSATGGASLPGATADVWAWGGSAAPSGSRDRTSTDAWAWGGTAGGVVVESVPSMVLHPQGMVPGTAIGAYLRWEWKGPVAAKLNAGPGAAVAETTVAEDLTVSFALQPGEYVAYAPAYPNRRLFFMVTE